jgi:hypothetical protein
MQPNFNLKPKREVRGSPCKALRYALARFDDPRAKKASLEVVIDQFPHDQAVRAAAEMELAYLILGADYRFATPGQCHRAIEAYRRVLVDHAELPAVCAKANWYIGWIWPSSSRHRVRRRPIF